MIGHGDCHSGTNIAVGPYEMSFILSTWQSVAYNKHIPWWHHQMETFSALLAICAGNSPDQWHGALMFSLISAWIYGWVSNREASDLRCNHTHYDVIVMCKMFLYSHSNCSEYHHDDIDGLVQDVTPLLMHWSNIFHALTLRYNPLIFITG